MEPPAKKRRQAPSLLDDDEDDDDELFFQPQEVSARRDPGYKLSVKRACADHKLHATMAHIIEKYSHNFEGIGDEIDMETGEIVVNNGHLTRMRNEGDVGGEWEGDEEDADEGIRLEDLTDKSSDNDREINEAQDSEEDEDLIMKGKEVTAPQNAVVAKRPGRPAPSGGKLSTLFPNPYGRGDAFGPPPAFGASPFAYGNSAMGLGSWGWSGSASTSGYGHQRTSHHAPPQRLSLTAGNDKYEFPAQEGYKSIWASGTGYDEDWALRPTPAVRTGFRKQVAKYPVKAQPQRLLDAPKPETTHTLNNEEEVDEKDEDAIVTGRSSQTKSGTNADENGLSDDEDSLLLSNPRSLVSPPESSPVQHKDLDRTKKNVVQPEADPCSTKLAGKRKRQLAEEIPQEPAKGRKQLVAMKTKKISTETQDSASDRRRSGRFKKQTEFMGKICWAKANGARKKMETLTVELFGMDPERMKDFHRVDKVADEKNPTLETAQDDPMSEVESEEGVDEEFVQVVNDEVASERIIPNSQDSGTPLTSSAPQEPQKNMEVPKFPGITKVNVDTTFVLSDDEAPLLLPEPRSSKHHKQAAKVNTTTEQPPKEIQAQSSSEARVKSSKKEAETASAPPRRPGRPKKVTVVSAPTPIPQTLLEELEAVPADSIEVSISEVPSPKERRKCGRPRKSDVLVPVAKSPVVNKASIDAGRDGPGESAEDSGIGPGSPVTAMAQIQTITPKQVERPNRLGNEIRWLQKCQEFNPKGAVLPETSSVQLPIEKGEPPKMLLRSVKSRELVKSSNEAPKEIKDSQEEESSQLAPADPSSAPEPELPTLMNNDDPFALPEDPPIVKPSPKPIGQPSATPRSIRIRDHASRVSENPASSPSARSKPHTPRHTHIRTSHAPSSRRSILSLLSDDDEDRDELGRDLASASRIQSSGATMRKLWRSTALTTEIHRTPVKKRLRDPASPGSVVKTPGGTTRSCGVDGYRCERDFCFTCL